jgi:hypothetical protein
MGSISATATYHLSSETTAIVVAYSPEEKSRIRTNFVGTIAERSTCIDVILTDLWDDVDGQLTAWEQLYARACVKCYFACHWKSIDESPDGSDSSEGDSSGEELLANSSEGSSEED